METLGLLFVLAGLVIACIGSVMILIEAFQTSVLWGLGILLVPFAGLVFVFLYWHETKKAFLINVVGVGLMILGSVVR